jgi:hypothetical protein
MDRPILGFILIAFGTMFYFKKVEPSKYLQKLCVYVFKNNKN